MKIVIDIWTIAGIVVSCLAMGGMITVYLFGVTNTQQEELEDWDTFEK